MRVEPYSMEGLRMQKQLQHCSGRNVKLDRRRRSETSVRRAWLKCRSVGRVVVLMVAFWREQTPALGDFNQWLR